MIVDEFTDLAISKAMKWHLRQVKRGKCYQCPDRPAHAGGILCERHLRKSRRAARNMRKYRVRGEWFIKNHVIARFIKEALQTNLQPRPFQALRLRRYLEE